MRTTVLFFAAVPLVLAHAARAQEVTATPTGEYTVRFRHLEGHDFRSGGNENFIRHRARLGLRFAYGEDVQALVQVQDVRIWGEETDTLGDYSANGFDLHQGYMEVALDRDLRLRVGRQEVSYMNHRLIGNVGFAEQGRSFDAIRLMARVFEEQIVIDMFYARTLDGVPEGSLAADHVFAYALRMAFAEVLQPAIIGVWDVSSGTDRVRATHGLVLMSEWPFGLRFGVEAYLQNGAAVAGETDIDYFAWMFATRLRFTLVDEGGIEPYFEGFVELLSGDAEPTNTQERAFDTLFASNHKFYGEADFFLNLPNDTSKRGLLDAGAVLGITFGGDEGFAQLAFHVFQTMASQGGPSDYGQELDLTLGWKVNPHLTLDFNYSMFFPGAAFAPDGDLEHFVYTTAATSF